MTAGNAKREQVLIFIPTYNDESELSDIVSRINSLEISNRILIVDDGSTSPINMEDLPSEVLRVRVSSNYGLGVATHIAIDHARAFGYGIILRVDADGQHPIESIPDLVRKLIDEGLDAVVGERTNRDDGSGIRSILAKSIRTYISFVVRSMTAGKAPEDVNSGFMAIGAKAAERLSRTMLDRYPEPQILTILGRSNLRTGSLQVQQLPRKKGRSSIGWFDGMRIFYRFNVFALGELIQGRDKP